MLTRPAATPAAVRQPAVYRTDFEDARRVARRRGRFLIVVFVAAAGLIALSYTLFVRHGAELVFGALPSPGWTVMLCGALAALMGLSAARTYRGLGAPRELLEALGARPLQARGPEERRLRNVVQEVAVAACIPAPAVYVFDRALGVNAVAVGTLARGALAVTDPALRGLDRDALQAVVAHEIAHLATGDTHLNRITAALVSALTLRPVWAGVGRVVRALASASPTEDAPVRQHPTDRYPLPKRLDVASREGASPDVSPTASGLMLVGLLLLLPFFYVVAWAAVVAVALAGLAVVPVLGALLAPLLAQAAARQREFHADALAVELTRNPAALARALRTVGGSVTRGHLRAGAQSPLQPFFFTRPDTEPVLSGWLGPHPPLAERVRRLERGFDGAFEPVSVAALIRPRHDRPEPAAPLDLGRLMEATLLLDAWPSALRDRLQEPRAAAAAFLACLVPEHHSEGEALGLIATAAGRAPAEAAEALAQVDAVLPMVRLRRGAERLALAEIAAPAVQRLSPPSRLAVARTAAALARLDTQVSLTEYAILQVLRFGTAGPAGTVRMPAPHALRAAARTLLAWLAHHGHPQAAAAEEAYAAGRDGLPLDLDVVLPPRPSWGLLDRALDTLRAAPAPTRAALVRAGQRCVAHDGRVVEAEAVALRALALVLGVPLGLAPAETSAPFR